MRVPPVRVLPDGSWLARAEDPAAAGARLRRNARRRRRGSQVPQETGPLPALTIRVIEFWITVTGEDGASRTERYRMLTTLLDWRQAPAAAVCLVGVIALATAAFPPNNAMVVFIFLISVSHMLILAAFLWLRHQEPGLARTYRALGGSPIAVVALLLSLAVMVSCYQLEARALTIAILVIAVLAAHFLVLHPARPRGK